MLNLNPDTVCFIISKARLFQAKREKLTGQYL
jgi:hypothetical protein